LVRYQSDGSLDATFNGGGVATTDFDSGADLANALLIQPDGNLVAGGGSSGRLALARYETDGSLDPTFGNAGRVVTDLAGSSEEGVFGTALQPDGKLVFGGYSRHDLTGAYEGLVGRYLVNGMPDSAFGIGGFATIPNCDLIMSVVVQDDGKIVVAGRTQAVDGDFLVGRLLEVRRVSDFFPNCGQPWAMSYIPVVRETRVALAGPARREGQERCHGQKTESWVTDTSRTVAEINLRLGVLPARC
jgi:uncharacterized delta-60 repeat protein